MTVAEKRISEYLIDNARVSQTTGKKLKLIRCPACEVDLVGKEAANHTRKHRPEDFGLSPLGVVR